MGGCHSEDGIKLEEVMAAAGDAKLLMRGAVLGAKQDASLLLTDFPIALLDPLFRGMPALQHAQPAVGRPGDLLSPHADLSFMAILVRCDPHMPIAGCARPRSAVDLQLCAW